MIHEEEPQTLESVHRSLLNPNWDTVQFIETFLERIRNENVTLQAYLHVCEGRATEAAKAIDELRKHHPNGLGRLAGAPLSVKDLIDTDFATTTYGSHLFRDHQPRTTATVIERLERAHGIILGKTHLHEFAFGITNENRHFGPARNPVDTSRMTGGSSGGSAASVAANLAVASVGTDTGGSIRIPASLTGVVGFKPSYGLLPTDGVWPLAPTLDHVGTLTKTVYDAAVLTEVMANLPTGILSSAATRPAGGPLRVAIPATLIERFASDDVAKTFEKLIRTLEASGILLFTGTINVDADSVATHQGHIMGAEAFGIHEELIRKHADLYGEDVLERLNAGAKVSAQDYIRSRSFQASFQRAVDAWFDTTDVLLLPTTPIVAPVIGTSQVSIHGQFANVRQMMTRFTNPWNLSGVPAISIPMEQTHNLPIGLQIVGQFGQDARLLYAAALIEQNLRQTKL